jgi:transposase
MAAVVIGLDISKNIFQVHGVDANGKVVVRRKLRCADLLQWFAAIDRTMVGSKPARRRTTGVENLRPLGTRCG